jgi:hypothetical protein
MIKIIYSVANGHVLRGDEKIATYEDGQLAFLPGKSNYRAPVVRWLNENDMEVDMAPERQDAEIAEPGAPVRPEAVEAVAEVAPAVAPLSVRVLARLTNVYPDAPAMTPEEGEKTPAFARWLIANHPEDARSRSALRKFFQ